MDSRRTIAAALDVDGLGDDARRGFEMAAEAGYRGVAFGSDHVELSPEKLSESGRRHLRALLAAKGLTAMALRSAGPRGGLGDPASIDRTMQEAQRAMLLARDLGVGVVGINIGVLAEDHAAPTATVVSALRELSQRADVFGLTLALGAENVSRLAGILKQVDYEKARADLDGRRMIGAGEDPLRTAEELAGRIGQFSATDAVRSGRTLRTEELGRGQLPLAELMELLREQGFDGPTVVDVRGFADGAAAAREAAAVLAKTLRS